MNLNYIFLLCILYCKKLLSQEFTKLLFCFISCQFILIITSKKSNLDIQYKKYRIKRKSPLPLTVGNPNSLKRNIEATNFKIPLKIKSTVKHLKNSTHFKEKNSPFKIHNYNISNLKEGDSIPHKTPILLSKFYIVESFVGDIKFPKNIKNIKNIKNTLILKSSTLILDNKDKKCGVLFLSGYLEIDLTYSVPENFKLPIISSTKNYVLRIPFNSALHVKFENPFSEKNFYFDNLNFCLTENEFLTDVKLQKELRLDNDISLFKSIRLSIVLSYSIDLYDFFNDK